MDTVSGGASGNPRVDCASRAGLTITELMVMMVMLAILLGLAIPRIDNWMRRARLKSAVAELTTAHFLTRSAAMRYGRPAALRIDAANGRFWVEIDTSVAGGSLDTVGMVHRMSEANVTMTSDRTKLCFDRRGMAYVQGVCEQPDARVIFTTAERTDSFKTSAIGKVLR